MYEKCHLLLNCLSVNTDSKRSGVSGEMGRCEDLGGHRTPTLSKSASELTAVSTPFSNSIAAYGSSLIAIPSFSLTSFPSLFPWIRITFPMICWDSGSGPFHRMYSPILRPKMESDLLGRILSVDAGLQVID